MKRKFRFSTSSNVVKKILQYIDENDLTHILVDVDVPWDIKKSTELKKYKNNFKEYWVEVFNFMSKNNIPLAYGEDENYNNIYYFPGIHDDDIWGIFKAFEEDYIICVNDNSELYYNQYLEDIEKGEEEIPQDEPLLYISVEPYRYSNSAEIMLRYADTNLMNMGFFKKKFRQKRKIY